MVRDGYYYGVSFGAAAILLAWLAGAWWALPPVLLAAFCMWFFRDPERVIPAAAGAVVSPGDGKVTAVGRIPAAGGERLRISIFLSVFDVHVNRSPVAGVVSDVHYRRGKFLNAMAANSADENEQNIVTVTSQGQTVVFKQIAGLIARRIIFNRKIGDQVARGERVGLIKFGSRVDVVLDSSAVPQVKVGDRVRGGESIVAYLAGNAVAQQQSAEAVLAGGLK